MRYTDLSAEETDSGVKIRPGNEIWSLLEYFETSDVRSLAERSTDDLNISLLHSTLTVLRQELVRGMSQRETMPNYLLPSEEKEIAQYKKFVAELAGFHSAIRLPEQRLATGRFVVASLPSSSVSLEGVRVVSSGYSPAELIGILDESLIRLSDTMSLELQMNEAIHSDESAGLSAQEISLGSLLSKLDYHPLEPGLDFYDAWALILRVDPHGNLRWNIAESRDVDKDLLLGLVSRRVKELRSWMEDSYSESEDNPYLSVQPVDGTGTLEESFAQDDDQRLENILLETEPTILEGEIVWSSVWVMGGDSDRGAYTNFVNAEARNHINRDQLGHMELGALLVVREMLLG